MERIVLRNAWLEVISKGGFKSPRGQNRELTKESSSAERTKDWQKVSGNSEIRVENLRKRRGKKERYS